MSHEHKIFGFSCGLAVTHATIARFQNILNDPPTLSRFLSESDLATTFLNTLAEGCEEWQDCLVEALRKPDAVFDLVRTGKTDAVWSMILRLSTQERQIAVLSAPEVVFILTQNGKADAVRHLTLTFPEDKQRLSVCCVPYAAFGMAKYGNTNETLLMIRNFSKAAQQAAILSTSHVVYGLADNLDASKSRTLITMIQQFSKDQQAAILASDLAVLGLVKNGKINDVLGWLRAFSKSQLDKVRNAAYVIPVLSENAHPGDIEFFIKDLPKKRDGRSRKERMSLYRSRQLH